MQLNIKTDEAHRLAVELTNLTGESLTEAVTEALRERLEREKARQGRTGMAKRLLEIGRQYSKRLPPDRRSSVEMLADLYDELGAPK